MTNGRPRSWDDALIVAYLDGELPPGEAARVEAMLREDPEAAETARLMQSGGQAARAAFADALSAPRPAGFAALSWPRLAGTPAGRPFDLFRWLGVSGARGLGFVAVVALVAFVGGLMGPWHADPSGGTVRTAGGPGPAADEESVDAGLLSALETAPDGAVVRAGPQSIRVIGPVDVGFAAHCRSFAADGVAGTGGVACRGPDGAWSVLTVQGTGAPQP
jgi:anti-sigma factor RsiW